MADSAQNLLSNEAEITVSQLSGAIKRTLEDRFDHVRVRGELGRVTFHRNGHVYLDLKDDKAVIAGVVWKAQVPRLGLKPEEGLEVIATGRITTYGPQSKYQLVVTRIELAGEGALMALLEKRKKQLAAEGLFAEDRKRALPFLPNVVGVVTSPTGAVIRDILHRLSDRFPRHVLVWPVAVQGQNSADEVAAAIKGFNALTTDGPVPRPDLLIVARGGGSLEDLWGFNEEVVVRAAAASEIPLISAVGHETDTTLIDFASDRRAPTPTAAAEMAVPVRAELIAQVLDNEQRLVRAVDRALTGWRQEVAGLVRGLPRAEDLIGRAQQNLDHLAGRLPRALSGRAQIARGALAELIGRLQPRLLLGVLEGHRERLSDLGARARIAALRRPADQSRMLSDMSLRLGRAMERHLRDERRKQADGRDRLEQATARLDVAWKLSSTMRQDRIETASRLLKTLSFEGTLERGYALVEDEDGGLVRTAADALSARRIKVRFAGNESVHAQVGESGEIEPPFGGKPENSPPSAKKTKRDNKPAVSKDVERQGRLL